MSRESRPFWGRRRRGGEMGERMADSMSGWEKDQFLLDSRRILLFQEIADDVVSDAIVAIQRLGTNNPKDPIFLYISSDGGFVDAGLALIDAMSNSPCPIHTVITGRAYSMAALIAAYGDERFITQNSSVMLHPIIYALSDDYVAMQQQESGFVTESYLRMTDALARRMKTTGAKLRKKISSGLWLTPAEAISAKVVDAIWTRRMETELCEKLNQQTQQDAGRLRSVSQLLKFVSHQIETGQGLDFEVEKDK